MASSSQCPVTPAETAEAYLLGHLPADRARAFEEHCIACPACAAVIDETERYIVAMKRAAKRLRDGNDEVER
jgi:anti-sigma factor RsiW